MEKNYYPLRAGHQIGTIVSDIPTREYVNQSDEDSDLQHYGGHFICEGVITQTMVKQLVDAYNEKYALEKMKPIILSSEIFTDIINGQVVCGLYRMFKINEMWMLTKKDGYEYQFIGERYGNWVFAPVQTKPSQQNSTHSFTEGMDVEESEDKTSLDAQIEYIDFRMKHHLEEDRIIYRAIKENLLAIKRWSQNPLWSQLNVEKVIEDLIQIADVKSRHPIIQNAEAALGMLQAFKQERGYVGTPLTKTGEVFDVPLKDGCPQKISSVDYELIDERFLLDRQWVRLTHRRYRYRDTENHIKLLNPFGTSEQNMMWIYEVDQEDGTMYFGKIPNQNQYNLLFELLEL